MTYVTPNLKLITYNIVSDGGVLTGSYVEAVSGSTIASDLMKIDRFAGEVSGCIAASASSIWGMSASIISTTASYTQVLVNQQGIVTAGSVTPARDGNIWMPASAMFPSNTDGCNATRQLEFANGMNIKFMDFSGSVVKYCEADVRMPDDWNGRALSASFVWMSASIALGTGVVWGIMGTTYADEIDLTDMNYSRFSSSASWVETEDLATTACYCQYTPSTGSFPLATKRASGSPAAGDIAHFTIRRSASATGDTSPEFASLMGVTIVYGRKL